MEIIGLERIGVKLFRYGRNIHYKQLCMNNNGQVCMGFFKYGHIPVGSLPKEKGETESQLLARSEAFLNRVEAIKTIYRSPDGTLGTYGFFKRSVNMGILRGLTVKF